MTSGKALEDIDSFDERGVTTVTRPTPERIAASAANTAAPE
jgi:hypothetical protein